jgi:hypothetical protein
MWAQENVCESNKLPRSSGHGFRVTKNRARNDRAVGHALKEFFAFADGSRSGENPLNEGRKIYDITKFMV